MKRKTFGIKPKRCGSTPNKPEILTWNAKPLKSDCVPNGERVNYSLKQRKQDSGTAVEETTIKSWSLLLLLQSWGHLRVLQLLMTLASLKDRRPIGKKWQKFRCQSLKIKSKQSRRLGERQPQRRYCGTRGNFNINQSQMKPKRHSVYRTNAQKLE